MGLARTQSVALVGVQAHVVDVEVDVAGGIPGFIVTALSDRVLGQVVHRVRSAVTNSGEAWPNRKVTVALSPAMMPKSGSFFDLPIVAGLLVANDALPADALRDVVVIGEVSLDGRVKPVTGVLPAVIGAYQAGWRKFVVPRANLGEARLVNGATVHGVGSVGELCAWLRGACALPDDVDDPALGAVADLPDFADVVGQESARLTMEVAAAGGHHVILMGPPGVGKTMLAERLPGLLPDLTDEEALEVTAIHSVVGLLPPGRPLITRPPFSAPHHSSTTPALVGGGRGIASPGAISLAHRGVLFLDEAPEFGAKSLDALRQPLESGWVTISRTGGVARYPCRFSLVLASNPCPCAVGGRASGEASCVCTATRRRHYLARLSGPLMDRVDLRAVLDPVSRAVLTAGTTGEPTARVRERVEAARDRTRHRLVGTPWLTNGEVPGPVIRQRWPVATAALRPLHIDIDRGVLSTRAVDRILRVAWTLADLGGRAIPTADDVRAARALRFGQPLLDLATSA